MDSGCNEMKDKLRFGWCMVALVMLLAAIATANPPTPKGIDGYVYHLDARTEVPDGTNYSVCNLNTTWCIQGVTGNYAHSGRISAAIKGNDGDLLIVRAWTESHNSSRTIVLNGSMHEVNLLLNASSHPPKLVSSPIEMAAEQSSIGRSIALTPGGGDVGRIIQAGSVKEYYFTPSPKFPDTLEVGGKIEGGSKSSRSFIIINKNTNATVEGIIKRGKSNEYYGVVEGKPGDTIVMRMGSGEELTFTPAESVEEFDITLKTPFNIWKIIAPVFGAALLLAIVIWRRRE
jgi:hypothetical protein